MSSANGQNGNGYLIGPWWARLAATVGAPTVIVLYLLGAVPGLRSPIDRILENGDRNAERIAGALKDLGARLETTSTRDRELLAVQQELLRIRRNECLRATRGDKDACGYPGTYVPGDEARPYRRSEKEG